MIKDEDYHYDGWFYFEQIIGAMPKGSVSIDGVEYYFDVITSIQQK